MWANLRWKYVPTSRKFCAIGSHMVDIQSATAENRRGKKNYTSLKNVQPWQLAIFFTYTVRLRQYLAQMLPRKQTIKMYFIFPLQLTSASALPVETGNPEVASFHWNAACFFTKKHETVYNVTWSELIHFSLSKRSSGCTRQDLGREHSILLSVTHMFCVSQVSHSVSRCVKGGNCSSSSLE